LSKNIKTALIIGAGPAGLTAAFELLTRTDIKPIVIEKTGDIGGISKTVNYKGNRIDLGGHRFFSKSERVMQWWLSILPLQAIKDDAILLSYQNKTKELVVFAEGPDPGVEDKVMLLRSRLSRILFKGNFFNYPVSANLDTFAKLGPARMARITASYARAKMKPVDPEISLEDFFVNRFGRELYNTFFRDYTHKVWGVHPANIPADWGRQRVKSLSVSKAIKHSIKKLFSTEKSISQDKTETSLIEQFLYPKYGPGQLWEEVADKIRDMGGDVLLHHCVDSIETEADMIKAVSVLNTSFDYTVSFTPDYVFSSMPVKELLSFFTDPTPPHVQKVAEGLVYRDFITVGMLLKKMKPMPETKNTFNHIIPDNWIYVQENYVKLGRIQVINNWSPYMVADPSTIWLGLEYFCNEGDELWSKPDDEMIRLAAEELEKTGLALQEDLLDATVIRMPKTYPAYFGSYHDFHLIRNFTDTIDNLFLIGRNGMHKYNNQDHSMLTAMTAVDNIVNGINTKDNIWAVNTEEDYHEEK
jgi:protoporphyrinogen oxidase